jgi:signal transduction histidine kinase/DNA-binding response OmpR family regulator
MTEKPKPVWHDALDALFSVTMTLDGDLTIVRSSDTLRRYLPVVADSPSLTDVFDIKRPAAITTMEKLRGNTQSLFLMIARDNSFAIRGQFTELDDREGQHIYFLGAPWLSWIHANCPDLKLGLSDFAPQDAQMDQLFYMSTEKRMIEDLEQLNLQLEAASKQLEIAQQEKNSFFAQMSHEMRTPLNGVVSALTLLGDQGLGGRAATLLDLAQESSRNLMQVIDYVLDVSKIELSAVPAQEEVFALPELIASVIDIVRAKAMEKGLELSTRMDGRLSSEYLGDAPLLRQCLLNLVINAIKYTDEGEININLLPASGNDMTFRIEVSDTGIGIAEADHATIFEPFRRISKKGSIDRGSGTGLGLDIVRRHVNAMGGNVGVISALGQGSTFWLELPLPVAQGHAADRSPRSPALNDENIFQGRVLLVDDNETNLMLGTMILESMGLEVLCAPSGEDAVATVRNEKLNMVLMDISMPGIDGFEATRQIRAFLEADELPIVALTAYASSIEREQSEKCGMNGYLTKPIDRNELASALKKWLPRLNDIPSIELSLSIADNAAALVDHEVLEDLAGQIGKDNLAIVLQKFLAEAKRRWAALEEANSQQELAREAHALASTCRSFGLPAVADKLACIEQHAKFGDASGEPPCIAQTGKELSAGIQILKSTMDRYTSPQ